METANYRLERWLALLLGLLFFLPFVAQADELLMPGSFHGDDVRAAHGEHWLALAPAGARAWILQPVRIAVTAEYDPIIDEPGEESGKLVEAIGGPETLALLRGTRLTPGPIVSATPSTLLLERGAPQSLTLGAARYELRLECGASADPEGFVPCAIVLQHGGASQQLATLDSSIDGETPELLWAGDADRDGRLDLLVDTSGHYNVWAPTLFLSSAARDGALVGQAAQFIATGC